MAHHETPAIYSIAKYPRTRLGDANRPPSGGRSPDIGQGSRHGPWREAEASFPGQHCARWNAGCPLTRISPAEAGPSFAGAAWSLYDSTGILWGGVWGLRWGRIAGREPKWAT